MHPARIATGGEVVHPPPPEAETQVDRGPLGPSDPSFNAVTR